MTSSRKTASDWEQYGATVYIGDTVIGAVEELKKKIPSTRYVVFTQRYDGIDLPDNACRILVLDGLPYGEGIVDSYDSSLSATPGGARSKLIYRIEQGMGRAVRSHVDYAVIILAGNEIASFVAKKEVLSLMNLDTEAQLKLAFDLSDSVRKESNDSPKAIIEMIKQCINRDEGWKQFYSEQMGQARSSRSVSDDRKLQLAHAERAAFVHAINNQHSQAAKTIQISLDSISTDNMTKAWYMQKMASYLYETDTARAMSVQQSARANNSFLFCPPGIGKRDLIKSDMDIESKVIEWFSSFENANGTIAEIERLRAVLSFESSENSFLNALKELAQLIGASGIRPEIELKEGPDCLWVFPKVGFVIEAKTKNENTLHKKDSGQLHDSITWFKKAYSNIPTVIPIVIAKVAIADNEAHFPEDARVLLPAKMQELLDNLVALYKNLASELPLHRNVVRTNELLKQYRLHVDQLVGQYTVKITRSSH